MTTTLSFVSPMISSTKGVSGTVNGMDRGQINGRMGKHIAENGVTIVAVGEVHIFGLTVERSQALGKTAICTGMFSFGGPTERSMTGMQKWEKRKESRKNSHLTCLLCLRCRADKQGDIDTVPINCFLTYSYIDCCALYSRLLGIGLQIE